MKDIKKYEKEIAEACHVKDLHKWLEKETALFETFLDEVNICKKIRIKLINLFKNGLISYNALDSISDGESTHSNLNIFLKMLIKYHLLFERLMQEIDESNREKMLRIRSGIEDQYQKCLEYSDKIKFGRLQGARSTPYVLPFLLAFFMSKNTEKTKYKGLIKNCFILCEIRQTSDDLRDLDDDLINQKTTLITKLFKHYGKENKFDTTSIKHKVASNTLLILSDKVASYNHDLQNDHTLACKWSTEIKSIIKNIEEYVKIISKNH